MMNIKQFQNHISEYCQIPNVEFGLSPGVDKIVHDHQVHLSRSNFLKIVLHLEYFLQPHVPMTLYYAQIRLCSLATHFGVVEDEYAVPFYYLLLFFLTIGSRLSLLGLPWLESVKDSGS